MRMYDFIIIGGGIIGLITARNLAAQQFSVAVLDKQAFGHGASWAGGGICSPLYPWRYSEALSALARRSKIIYPELITALQAETGIDPEWSCSGLLTLDSQDAIPAQ